MSADPVKIAAALATEKTFTWLYRFVILGFATVAGWMGNAAYGRVLDIYDRIGHVQETMAEITTTEAVLKARVDDHDRRLALVETSDYNGGSINNGRKGK